MLVLPPSSRVIPERADILVEGVKSALSRQELCEVRELIAESFVFDVKIDKKVCIPTHRQVAELFTEKVENLASRISRGDEPFVLGRPVVGRAYVFERGSFSAPQLAGMVWVDPFSEVAVPGVELDGLYVGPKFQGRGVGSALLNFALSELGNADSGSTSYPSIGLYCRPELQSFYEGFGFQREARSLTAEEREGFSVITRDGRSRECPRIRMTRGLGGRVSSLAEVQISRKPFDLE